MSEINVKRFVDIDIKPRITSSVIGTRETVVLFTPEGTATQTRLISSLAEAIAYYESATTTLAYLTAYFNNGGISCLVIEGIGYDSVTATMLSELEDKYIVVAFAIPDSSVAAGYTAIKGLAVTREADTSIYGVNEKLLLVRSNSYTDTALVKNFVVKYSSVVGAEMSIAAYLSRINVYGQDTVYDYSFTNEDITPEELTDTIYGTIITNNYNVDITLANTTVNMGGNCKNGDDITNKFVNIVLHQTLTDRLIRLLTQKIKDARGLAQIYTVIAQELESYKTAGYISTDKIWADADLTITYNGAEYVLVPQGTPLSSGYIIRVLPLSSLSTADKTARKTPPIYVVLADQYGIRSITVNGEVI